MIKDLLDDAQDRMEKVEKILISDYASLRAGRATPALLDKITAEYYGTPTPINQMANISCPEPRLIVVQPWDKNQLSTIEKAILKSDLGITPNNDGTVIRLAVPTLTEERRREIVKQCGKKAEDAKVAVRNIRREANDKCKEMKKSGEMNEDEIKQSEKRIQDLTDKYIKEIDAITEDKNKEIMSI